MRHEKKTKQNVLFASTTTTKCAHIPIMSEGWAMRRIVWLAPLDQCECLSKRKLGWVRPGMSWQGFVGLKSLRRRRPASGWGNFAGFLEHFQVNKKVFFTIFHSKKDQNSNFQPWSGQAFLFLSEWIIFWSDWSGNPFFCSDRCKIRLKSSRNPSKIPKLAHFTINDVDSTW